MRVTARRLPPASLLLVAFLSLASPIRAQSTPPAGTGSSGSAKAGAAAAGAGNAAGGGAPQAKAETAPAPRRIDDVMRVLHAPIKAVTDLLGAISWTVVTLIVLVVARTPLRKLFDALIEAVKSRGVTFAVWSVKVQISERSQSGLDESARMYSPSPFDLDDSAAPDAAPEVQRIPPQLLFQVSDYVAAFWAKGKQGAEAVASLRSRRDALLEVCREHADIEAIKGPLLRYVHRLEAARFREAREFGLLIAKYPVVATYIRELRERQAPNEDALFIMHCAGMAYAQMAEWEPALDLLDHIAWKDGQPRYLPAGSGWMPVKYYALLKKLAEAKDDEPFASLHADIDALFARGLVLLEAMKHEDWRHVPVKTPKGFYLREMHKAIGQVASIVADYLTDPAERARYFAKAEEQYQASAQPVDEVESSPLDHNNLADLYRQRGDFARRVLKDEAEGSRFYDLAQKEIEKALPSTRSSAGDPTFHNTLALLRASQQRPDAALIALAEYSENDALAAEPLDQTQYVDNQVLAAKLLAAQRSPLLGLPPAVAVLQAADNFLDRFGNRIGLRETLRLRAQIDELLGFANLQLPREESAAFGAFDRLIKLPAWQPRPIAALRARIGRALALGRMAAQQRRSLAPAIARQHRSDAAVDVAWIQEPLRTLKVDVSVPLELRTRNIGLWLDAARAAQLLAEETLAGFEGDSARERADLVAALISTLRTGLTPDEDATQRAALRRLQARHALLNARLTIYADPDLQKAETLPTMKDHLLSVRDVSAEFSSLADLELGSALLTSVRLKKGSPEADYVAAIVALERAVMRDAPAIRGDALRALQQAYAIAPGVRVNLSPNTSAS